MAQFSATDAAFEGFRLTRERPKTVLVWGVVYVLGIGAVLAIVFGLGGAALLSAGDRSPEEAAAALGAIIPALLLMLPLLLLVSAVLLAALYRAVLTPEDSRRAYLRLSGDEVRLALLSLLLGVIGVLVALSLVIFTVLMYRAAAPLGVLAGIASFCFFVWGAVRLSFAAPMTFHTKRISIGGSFRLTKGRFWPLLGTYLLAIVFAILVSILAGIISAALLASFGGGISALSQTRNPDFSEFGAGLALGFGLYLLVQLIAALLQFVIQSAPPVAAYRDIAGVNRAADVFS